MNRVSGKVALVTGAASGLGKAITMLLAREGARVSATDSNEAGGEKTVEEIRRKGGIALFLRHDVASEPDWKEAVWETLRTFGSLDVLVNCAGVYPSLSIMETTFEKWRWVMSINLDATFLGIKYGAEVMRQTGGSIINISSTAGMIGVANSAAYSASKGGVRLLTKAAAIEFARAGYNIRVNSVHPGVIKTPMSAPLVNDPVVGKALIDGTPIGFLGEPDDVAYGVLYLASDESRFVTGSEMVIDGGRTAC